MIFAKECLNKEKQFTWPDISVTLSKEGIFKKFSDENVKEFAGTHCC